MISGRNKFDPLPWDLLERSGRLNVLRKPPDRRMHCQNFGRSGKTKVARHLGRLLFREGRCYLGRALFKSAARSSSTGSRFSATLTCLPIPWPFPSTDEPVESSKNRSANAGKKLLTSLLGLLGENRAQNPSAKSTICCLRKFRGRPVLLTRPLRAASRTVVRVGMTPARSNSLT